MKVLSLKQAGSFSFLFINMISQAMAMRGIGPDALHAKLFTYFTKLYPEAHSNHARHLALATFRRFTDDRLDARSAGAIIEALELNVEITLTFEEKPKYPAIWDQDINELDLPARATNCVRYGGHEEIHYIGQLVKLSANEVRKFVNVGETTLRHIEVGLTNKGLKFETDVGNWKPPQP